MRDIWAAPRPLRWLEGYGGIYPSAWKIAKSVRSSRGSQYPDWPEWCFLPLPAGFAMAEDGGQNPPQDRPELLLEAFRLVALASWRMTKGVYRFDEDLLEDAWDAPTADRPVSLDTFLGLPEWCVYVETPGRTLPLAEDGSERPVSGFFAHLNYYEGMGYPEVRLVVDVPESDGFPEHLFPLYVGLTKPFLRDCVVEDLRRSAAQNLADFDQTVYIPDDLTDPMLSLVGPPLSLLMRLCSPEREVRNVGTGGRERPGNPTPERATRKGRRVTAADEVTFWGVS